MRAAFVRDLPRPPAGIANPFDTRGAEARWRLSPDVFRSLAAETWPEDPDRVPDPSCDRLMGWPVDVDESLPPNSMLLELDRP
jgi:hypothetical protein